MNVDRNQRQELRQLQRKYLAFLETMHRIRLLTSNDGVRMERVSGNYQHARTGDRLPQPLVVRVSDGTRVVRDQRVRFTASGGRLYATSSSLFIRESGSVEGTTAISVKTDSRGEAKVYFTTPSTPNQYFVNAEVAPTPPAVNGVA